MNNPKGEPVWQLNKPISDMSHQERLEALGYTTSLIRAGHRELGYLYRVKKLMQAFREYDKKVKGKKGDKMETSRLWGVNEDSKGGGK